MLSSIGLSLSPCIIQTYLLFGNFWGLWGLRGLWGLLGGGSAGPRAGTGRTSRHIDSTLKQKKSYDVAYIKNSLGLKKT